jgi:biopolymer transport protein ExbD
MNEIRCTGTIKEVRRYRTRLRSFTGWPEMTALIDILFLTLLFFILSSSFVRVSGISVELPRLDAVDFAVLERCVVTITAPDNVNTGGEIFFGDKKLSEDTLPGELSLFKDNFKNASVIIRADYRVPFDTVAKVMEIAESAQMPCFIAVMPENNKDVAGFEEPTAKGLLLN